MRFVSLHTHSTFSYGDGYGPVRDHVKRVHDLGMRAMALTEHGNTSSHVQLEKACNEFGIKPIFGLEAYTAPPHERRKWHQTVLAMNAEGLRNLNRIVTRSWRDNFYQWPTVSSAMLEEHNEGLIVTSGCADSLLACTLLGGKSNGPKRLQYSDSDFERAIGIVQWYQSIFGDRYYLEVQRFPSLDRCCVLNPALARLSRSTGARLVATADVHYPFPDDNEMQKILHAAHRGGTVETAEAGWEYDVRLTYPTSDREIYEQLVKTGLSPAEAKAAVLETERIAKRCNVDLPKNEPLKFPYDTSQWGSIEDYVWDLLRQGWEFRSERNSFLAEKRDEYVTRIKYEMERIIPRGFCDYFAMLSDAVRFAKDAKIPVGPARGSAAASLVCYLLRITEVDPLQHPHMLFERFIDPKRLDLPDVDLDFASSRRDEVRLHLVRRYGADRVGNIGTFTKYKGKNSLDDVARVYKIPAWDTNVIKELIIERSGGDSRISDSLQDTFDTFPNARAVVERHPEFRLAPRLEGNYRGFGVHAAGLVISNAPISDTCAVYTRESNGRPVSAVAYDKKDADYLGMLKADFLGLGTMDMIGTALDIIGMDLEDLYAIPLDDAATLRAFKHNDVTGIFQFEGRATRLVCHDVSPDNFQQLADINALSRPGPLFSGMTAQYVEVRHGRSQRELLHPIVDAQTDWTYGQIVYQEQVLSIIRDLGGFPVQRVGDIRKIISQKLGEASFQEMWAEFRDGAKRLHDVDEDLALRIWRFMVTSATYSFNIAHCVSYSMLAFWQMWIKQNHPTAFYAAQLTEVGDGNDPKVKTKRSKLMQDALKHGQTIAPPDIKLSSRGWIADVTASRVVAGFTQIAGIGPKTADYILGVRAGELCGKCLHEEHSEYTVCEVPGNPTALNPSGRCQCDIDYVVRPDAWDDLASIKGIGPKTVERISAFVQKDDPFDLQLVGKILTKYRKMIRKGGSDWYGIPRPTHKSGQIPKELDEVVWMGIVRSKNYQDYIENQRTRTGREVAEIMADMRDPHLVKSCVLHCYDDDTEDVYVRFNRWTFPGFEEAIENIAVGHDIIIVTGRKRDDFGISLHVKDLIVIDPSEDM